MKLRLLLLAVNILSAVNTISRFLLLLTVNATYSPPPRVYIDLFHPLKFFFLFLFFINQPSSSLSFSLLEEVLYIYSSLLLIYSLYIYTLLSRGTSAS